MFGNGAGIGMVITIVVRRAIQVIQVRTLPVCDGVGAGAMMPVAAGLLIAAASVLATTATFLASALPAVQNRIRMRKLSESRFTRLQIFTGLFIGGIHAKDCLSGLS